jgi:UPF0716 protein FxsA
VNGLDVNKSKLVAFALSGWLILEIVVFALVVQMFGVLAAVALGLATTLLGLADVKRLFVYLRSRVGKPKPEGKAGANLLDGGLHALGSLLLILPGFVSDFVGLALKSPSIRAGLARRLRDPSGPGRGPRTIDLAPNEWKALSHRDRKRNRSAGAEPQF